MLLRFHVPMALVILSGGCKPNSSTPPAYKNQGTALSPDAQQKTSASADEKLATSAGQDPEKLKARNEAETKELALLEKVNAKLCLRLDRMRTECLATVRLVSDGEKILGCDGQYSGNASIQHQFTVTLSAPFGTYKLEADRSFESDTFENGSEKIIWKAKNNSNVQAPRLLDIASLRILPTGGAALNISQVQFSLKVDETELIKSSDLIAVGDGVGIDPQAIQKLKDTPACAVTAKELDEIIEAARTEVKNPKTGVSSATSVEDLQKSIADRSAKLERERDRNGKLKRELLHEADGGCHMEDSLKKIEVLISGTLTSDPDFSQDLAQVSTLGLSNKRPLTESGNPDRFFFKFGESFGESVDGKGIFGGTGKVLLTEYSDRKVRDIEYVSIEREGFRIFSEEKKSCGFLGIGCSVSFKHFETERPKVYKITLKVNDDKIFEGDVNHSFTYKEQKLEIPAAILKANESFVKFKMRDDCTQTQ